MGLSSFFYDSLSCLTARNEGEGGKMIHKTLQEESDGKDKDQEESDGKDKDG